VGSRIIKYLWAALLEGGPILGLIFPLWAALFWALLWGKDKASNRARTVGIVGPDTSESAVMTNNQRMDKEATDGQRSNGWTKKQRIHKEAMDRQGSNG